MELTEIINKTSPDEKQRERSSKPYNPSYVIIEDYLSSMRCPCACNPGPPGPYCGPSPCGPPKCSKKITYNK